MATSLAKATEMGFAEFASTLISQTLNAVVTSALMQEKQVAQLQQQTLLTPQEYAAENLTDDLVRAEIIRLFPASNGASDKSSVDAGEPYLNKKETAETPAVYNKTNYRLTKADLTLSAGKAAINSSGYEHIFAATKLILANQHLNVLKTVVSKGVPRVYVDSGHISSKLTLRFEADTTTANPASTGSRIAGMGLSKIYAQPINPNKPEYLSLKADILSEVEITFKTVVP
jgi:hypothetical protein